MNVDANPGAVTRHIHAREPLSMSKVKNYYDFWFPYKNCRGDQIPCENCCALHAVVSGYRTKITVVTNYRATITVYYRGGWLPYKVFRGCQLPSTNYRAIPWWLFTAANVTEMKNRYRGKSWFFRVGNQYAECSEVLDEFRFFIEVYSITMGFSSTLYCCCC